MPSAVELNSYERNEYLQGGYGFILSMKHGLRLFVAVGSFLVLCGAASAGVVGDSSAIDTYSKIANTMNSSLNRVETNYSYEDGSRKASVTVFNFKKKFVWEKKTSAWPAAYYTTKGKFQQKTVFRNGKTSFSKCFEKQRFSPSSFARRVKEERWSLDNLNKYADAFGADVVLSLENGGVLRATLDSATNPGHPETDDMHFDLKTYRALSAYSTNGAPDGSKMLVTKYDYAKVPRRLPKFKVCKKLS